MARRAVDGLDDLIDRTGGESLVSTVTVDQPYAQDQHESLQYRHPRGGRAKYLEAPMMENHRSYLQSFANDLLKPRSNAGALWGEVGRSLADDVPDNTPREFGDLMNSAALEVKEGGRTIRSDAPIQDRLSEQELDAKDYMRYAGQGYRE